jgi:GTP-binding nuclear protein Ran
MIDSVQAKLILVGDGGVGKTTLVKRHQTGEFEPKYIPTLGVEISYLTFHTSRCLLTFEVWDTAGQERFGGLREGYYFEADCAILMFDLTSAASYRSVPNWHRDIVRQCPEIPIVLVGNKADSAERAVPTKRVSFHKENQMEYFEISARTNYRFELPFLWLARKLMDDSGLEIVAPGTVLPPQVALDRDSMELYERELGDPSELQRPVEILE